MAELRSNKKKFKIREFAEFLPEELGEGFSNMVISTSEEEIKNAANEAKTVENELLELVTREKIMMLTQKISDYEQTGKSGKMRGLQREFQELSEKLSELQEE